MRPLLLPLLLSLLGCDDKSSDDSDALSEESDADTDSDTDTDTDADTDSDTDSDTDADMSLSATVTWDSKGVMLFSKGSGTYNFGMAETAVGVDGWHGEDCLNGSGPYRICHEGLGGVARLDGVFLPDDVVAGETTLLNEDLSDGVTYFVLDVGSGECLVFGDDPTYYESSGCTVE